MCYGKNVLYIWTNKGNTLLHSITMKNRFRLFLLAITALMVPLAVYAQEDVTSTYVLNPGFEESPGFFHDSTVVIPGWNVSKKNLLVAFQTENDGEAAPQGKNVFGIWAPGAIGDFEISQTVRNLPAGTYVISCVMTTTKLEYTTQRMFVSTLSAGTKSMYFESVPLDTISGENFSFAGYPDNGNGNGPFHSMMLKIKVAAGEPLVFGIRTNGTKSIICPILTTLGKNGNFKVDDFKLNFIPDDAIYVKGQIQEKIDILNAFPLDSIPGGYIALIQSNISKGQNVIATENNIDAIEKCNAELEDLIAAVGIAKGKFVALKNMLRTFEIISDYVSLSSYTNLPVRAEIFSVYNHTIDVSNSNNSLNSDFDKAYFQLDSVMSRFGYIGPARFGLGDNLALKGTASTSNTSQLLNLSAVKDGFEPSSSSDTLHTVHGSWDGSNGKINWVQYEWPELYYFTSVYVYWYTDFGSISQPVAATVEYWKDNEWKSAGAIDTVLNKWNVLKLDDLVTNKVRLSFQNLNSTGICEFGAVGFTSKYLTAIHDLNQDSEAYKSISINPNPVNDRLTIDFGSLINGSVRITNVLGQTVYYSRINNQKAEINTTNFATGGLFFVQIFDHQNELILSKKILK